MQDNKKKVIILGAGGRDFHNFNVYFRENPDYQVMAFTATQIPNIENRIYPRALAGSLYPKGIPVFPENQLSRLVKQYNIDEVIFAYSDVSHLNVMHLCSEVLAAGADFRLMAPPKTLLKSRKPVISVCAVRTGCGKSKLTLALAEILKRQGKRVIVVRHPMPYGDFEKQICQRFANMEDLDLAQCTIEEREEYTPLIKAGFVVFAGIDYQKILAAAEKEADIILWDGGNNDFPFFKPNLHIVVCDPHRPNHEILYHPGEANLRMADLLVVNKINTAEKENIAQVLNNIKALNPKAKTLLLESKIVVKTPNLISGKTVLVVEDGPTVTHGEMPYGAGYLAAKQFGAKEILRPKDWAKGDIKKTFQKYPHLEYVLPALGYQQKQLKELEKTINAVPSQVVLVATPVDLNQVIKINKPVIKVDYEVAGTQTLTDILKERRII